MKIPEPSSNVGTYYGNDDNGQWQPNSVILDNGVGGGVVGSGDAGLHRPSVYPVHIHRGHIPGYVMAGAYYPPGTAYPPVPAAPQDDFADYMWMENEEEFDKQVMQQLEEEALMEQCIEAMLEDEQRERTHRPVANGHKHYPTTSNGSSSLSLEETVSRSTLNPLAAEFVPTRARLPPTTTPTATEEKQETQESSAPVAEVTQKDEEVTQVEPAVVESRIEVDDVKTEEPTPPQDPPEVSAADITDDKRPKDKSKKPEPRKPVKQETKPKVKPQVVKSETKVPAKKKEVKNVKSDVKVDEKEEVTESDKPQPTPTEETPSQPGIKPINYAAAAKANKPKKPSSPQTTEKTPPPQDKKPKSEKPKEKILVKPEKPVQRKNSTK